uniref:Uncharacterized protein n=1 Tax=Panagrolaimus sp. ES5 TaxID=591445 RepID=A0AC34G5N0_9BILA
MHQNILAYNAAAMVYAQAMFNGYQLLKYQNILAYNAPALFNAATMINSPAMVYAPAMLNAPALPERPRLVRTTYTVIRPRGLTPQW